jgi:exopolyphosphatase/guanosine-5'-triphosphate,3'-diphosphate pyrophosphatase
MKPSKIVVSALGVREGFLFSLLSEEEQRLDPLITASEELAVLRARSVMHAHELVRWTGQSLSAFGVEETEEEARYRHAACLLADIGWRAHPEYRGTQSLNIIAHASFIGVDHPGRAFLALANFYRHEGLFTDAAASVLTALATPRYVERARLLGGLLRVVYLLSASMPGVIPKLRWESRANGALALVIPASHAGLDGERPAGRLVQLAKLTGRRLELVVEGEQAIFAAK